MMYRRDAEKMLAEGNPAEKKRVLHAWVKKIQLAPESLEVEINYKIPEPVVDRMGAGVELIPNHQFSPITLSLS